MNDHGPPSRDPQFDLWLASTVTSVEREIDEDRVLPDLEAVVSMARRLDPNAVPVAWVEEAAQYAPLVGLEHGRRHRRAAEDHAMDDVLRQVRAAVDHGVAVELSTRERPSPPRVRRATRWGWAAVTALAAVVVGSLAVGRLAGWQASEERREGGRWGAAMSRTDDEPDLASVDVRAPAGGVRARGSRRSAEAFGPDLAPRPEVVTEPEPAAEPELEPPGQPPESATRPRSSASRLRRLDDEAHQAWKAGDLSLARARFSEIAKIGGRRRLADLAFGDLFTIARQTGDLVEEARLWKAYLHRFPRGRFSDDARAGLCRQSPARRARSCWEAYVRDVPQGAYRHEAMRHLDSPGGDR